MLKPILKRQATIIGTTAVMLNDNMLLVPLYNMPKGLELQALWLNQIAEEKPLTNAVINGGFVSLLDYKDLDSLLGEAGSSVVSGHDISETI